MPYYKKTTLKELPAKKTIQNSRRILKKIGITIIEKDVSRGVPGCFSVRIEPVEIPYFGANGKGVTKDLALAGAYAEFLERLQNNVFLGNCYGLKKEYVSQEEDNSRKYNIKKIIRTNKKIFQQICSVSDKKIMDIFRKDSLICKKYFHINEKRFCFLPSDFINLSTGSTGMCAGNTDEEALVQGFCEIFERHITEKVHKESRALPTIPINKIKDKWLTQIIVNLTTKGYKVSIKDCTYGGDFPVLAVILTFKNSLNYTVRFGSHPIFEIALTRCFTEIFQGVFFFDPDHLLRTKGCLDKPTEKLRKEEIWRQCVNGTGKFSSFFIKDEAKYNPRYKNAFTNTYNNKLLLKKIIKKLKNDHQIYIRDLDYLGFSTFKIFIPELSSINKLSNNDLLIIKNNRVIKKYLLRIGEITNSQARECADMLKIYLDTPSVSVEKNSVLKKICKVFFKVDSDFYFLLSNYDYLLSLLYLKSKNYNEARKFLKKFLKNNGKIMSCDDNLYYNCVISCLDLKTKTKNKSSYLNNAYKKFGEKLTKEIIKDINNSSNIFKNYSLPRCGKSCKNCPTKIDCEYHEWNKIIKKCLKESNSVKHSFESYINILD